MHKVQRNEPPVGLEDKSNEWKKQLNETKDISLSDEWTRFKTSKLGKQTLESLKNMYLDCCMYCEGVTGATSYPQIEHFRPKSIYPELSFEYNNLHLVCQKCNSSKGDKFDERYIDPTVVDPREHIYYKAWEVVGKDEIGKLMVKIVDLNDSDRMKWRMKMCVDIKERIEAILPYLLTENVLNNSLVKQFVIKSLNEVYEKMQYGSPYCTMIEDNFKEQVDLIYKKLNDTF